LLAACLAVFVSPELGTAQTLQSCLATQIQYAGTTCRGMAKCYVKPMRKEIGVDPGCTPERDLEVQSRINSVEALGDCLVEPAGSTVANMLTSSVDGLAASLNGTSSGRCGAGKMGALGRACKQMLRCYTDAVYDSVPVDPVCLDQATNNVISVFDRMETKFAGQCDTTGDAAARNADLTTLTDDLYDYLRGTGTTTTSTTVTSTTTTTVVTACAEDGSFEPCAAYRDNGACTTCVDTAGGIAASQCTGAGPACGDSFQNQACGYAINTATSCGATCCP